MQGDLLSNLVAWRRHLHSHPELSGGEGRTAEFVAARLGELGIPFVSGVGGHGLVATLRRGAGLGSVGLRADIDALPITEEGALPYASQASGVMHACGHDGNTVALLGAAASLARDDSWTGPSTACWRKWATLARRFAAVCRQPRSILSSPGWIPRIRTP